MSGLISVVAALLLIIVFGLLCGGASFWLGKRLRVTDKIVAIILGVGVFPLPFTAAYILARLTLHLPYDTQYMASGIIIGGWVGAGVARIENVKQYGGKL